MAEDINNSLFSQDELDSIQSAGYSRRPSGPVTVLGRTFNNDEERRVFFREELRKKLPELKKIEGYPVGSDDSIIALSDPPFYTACPNPWLNDFIEEWEKEKQQLIKAGKRASSKVVTEPYASDVSEGKNNAIYMAHAYHTKCPHPAIMRYILHYTEPGDIVFDGFCGTGMTGVAANLCADAVEVARLNERGVRVGARHSLCSDLSPMASLIAASYNLPLYTHEFNQKGLEILKQVEDELGWMYEIDIKGKKAKVSSTIWSDLVMCPSCGHESSLWELTVDEEKSEIKSSFSCPHCGSDFSKKKAENVRRSFLDHILNEPISQCVKVPVRFDYVIEGSGKRGSTYDCKMREDIPAALEQINKDCLPHSRMPEGDEARRNDRDGRTHVHHFYTLRSVIYLARVYELCKGDPHLVAWFTSTLLSTSVMNKFRFSGTGINSGTLYIPSINWEFTPYNTLKRKLNAFISADYKGRGNSVVSTMSATKLDSIPDNSVDYMFIDPPFGANLMYSELNFIWEDWLKVYTESRDEAIVNNTQNKGLFEYQQLMNLSLKEFYRILKPGKWLTMEFSNTSASVWNSIQNALQGVGFVVANVAALDKKQGSFKAVTTTTAVKQDLVITCFKPTEEFSLRFENNYAAPESAWDFIEEYLRHLPVHLERGNSTTTVIERSPKILYDRLISFYVQKGLPVPIDATVFQTGLRERFEESDGMFFTPAQLNEYVEKKKLAPEFVPMGLIVGNEADGIEWLRNQLRDNPKTYQDIQPDWLQAINGIRKGDVLPELMEILDENFIQEPDGKWRLPNIQDDVDKDKLREKTLLKEFAVYVDAASKPHARIKEVRVEAIRAGFKKCYMEKDFATIVMVGDKIPQNLLTEDDILLQFYDIARTRV